MKMSLGAKIDLAPNLEFTLRGAKIDSMATRVERVAGPALLSGAIWLENRGLKIIL